MAVAILAILLVSCQFTETLVMNEDGTGTMAISMDLSEMMAFSGEMAQDSSMVKQDTIVSFKDLLEQKKDSIAQLPMAEQKRLKAMKNYKMKMVTDPETNKEVIDIFTDFQNISEANDWNASLLVSAIIDFFSIRCLTPETVLGCHDFNNVHSSRNECVY